MWRRFGPLYKAIKANLEAGKKVQHCPKNYTGPDDAVRAIGVTLATVGETLDELTEPGGTSVAAVPAALLGSFTSVACMVRATAQTVQDTIEEVMATGRSHPHWHGRAPKSGGSYLCER